MPELPQRRINAAELLSTLEDVTHEQLKLVKSLRSSLIRVKHDSTDFEQQRAVIAGIRRLRVLRRRLIRVLGGIDEDFDPVLEGPEEVVDNAATLSEYMILVGFKSEEEVLRRALLLAKRGAELLSQHADDIRRDLEEMRKVIRVLERIVEKYYE